MIVVVDDERTLVSASDTLAHCRTSNDAVAFLTDIWVRQQQLRVDRVIDELYLDHDLGGMDTTMPIVRLLVTWARMDAPLDVGTIVIHTKNPVAALTMWNQLKDFYTLRRGEIRS